MVKKLLWIVAVAWAGIYICGPIVDPDLWWHIVIGRWIVAHHQLPHQDIWTQFGDGSPWRAYSWLVEILFAWTDRSGVTALFLLKLSFALALCFSLAGTFSRIANDWVFGALLGIVATVACFNHFTLRPQSLIWVLFAGILALCLSEKRRFSATHFLGLVVLMSLWANIHLSSVLGLLAIGASVYGVTQDRRLTVYTLSAGVLGTLLTPYLGGEWLTFVSKVGHPFQHSSIAEFQPATINQYQTVFLLLLAAVLLFLLHKRPGTVHPVFLITCGLFVFGGLAVNKFLPFAVFMLAATLALLWREEHQSFASDFGLAQGLWRLVEGIREIRPLAGVSLSLILLFSAWSYLYSAWRTKIAKQIVAVEAMDFIQGNKLPLPLLNTFGDGGYVLYRYADDFGNPGYKVPIDGRTNVTPREIQDKHHAAFSGYINWKEYLDVVHPKTVLWRTASPLTALLMATGQWCVVYQHADRERGHSVLLERGLYQAEYPQLASINCQGP